MLLRNRKSRKSIAILSAGAAALLITGLGVSNAAAATLNWDPGLTGTSGSNGSGTWDTSTANWSDGTSDVVWNSADAAGFTTSGSGTYTVSVANGISAVGMTVGSFAAKNNYTFQSAGTGSYTLADTGILAIKGGTVTLQNLTIDNSSYNNNNPTGISEAYTATLNIGTGGYLKGQQIAAGLGGAPGVINVNSGGTLSESNRIQVNFGNGQLTGNALNVNGGTVTMSGGIAFLSDSALKNSTGVMTVGAGGTGGNVSVVQFNTGGSGSGQTGVLNIDSGTVTATATPSITAGGGHTTEVNLNGGVLAVKDITEAGGTNPSTTIVNFNGGVLQALATIGIIGNPGSGTQVPTSLNVQAGGAVVDSNGFGAYIYNPLLHDSSLGTTPDGGLTVENTGGNPKAFVGLTGANTYTGPTVIDNGATLRLGNNKVATSIADTSNLDIRSGATLDLTTIGGITNANVGNVTMSGGTIDMQLTQSGIQGVAVTGTGVASISGTNYINLSTANATSLNPGTYNVISDPNGGLTGDFVFSMNSLDTYTATVNSINYLLTLNNSSTAETLTVSAVPEPTAVALLAVGAMGLLLLRRRKPAA